MLGDVVRARDNCSGGDMMVRKFVIFILGTVRGGVL